MKEEIESLKERFQYYYNEFENGNDDVDQEILDLEEKVVETMNQLSHYVNTYEVDTLSEILNDIKKFKREINVYDAEDELDMMFPNRDDEDFDEDSMSWGSVFGGE